MAHSPNNMLIGKKRQNTTFLNKKKENDDNQPAKKKRKFTRKDIDPTDKRKVVSYMRNNPNKSAHVTVHQLLTYL